MSTDPFRILGIDPGINGGLAVIQQAGHLLQVVDLCDIPTIGDASRREINDLELIYLIKDFKPMHAYVENVRAMPSLPDGEGNRRTMGAASAFKFGFVAGQIRTCVRGCKVPLTLVEASVWKRKFALRGGLEHKEDARQAAIRWFPAAQGLMNRKRDVNRAEALLIARYGALHGDHRQSELFIKNSEKTA
jgi:crossover junction endodeoxyribonuclease RuvC